MCKLEIRNGWTNRTKKGSVPLRCNYYAADGGEQQELPSRRMMGSIEQRMRDHEEIETGTGGGS